MATFTSERTKKAINRIAGARRNQNGAGAGARLVARRTKWGTVQKGRASFGTREQKRNDLRSAFGVKG